ncbi:uncharacterized protein L969DRAFT_86508 [Mixia osmundae IAM 14324]|uniref:Choline/ethanolaminephosphotransferase n=1 Tax=Mixia osmundae (strain CBS 9802 / IAM 14324 / JCM 22182 / KY 12970) TaxID=764103 RepID=G7E9G2_MIXOS|nr:uncharacterized protein L969DRAFT_86508 [Mixia osmundae IAM 14324]KEI39914.1 hypothetical protein L969DRAFT_86508 [Mixia osmundae IAM 14324]GAA99281.1 hypothetical protein E5Q_05976 [Mixia osmundae IAM 14324]
MGFFIPASRRQNLAKYAYSGTDKSLLSRYLLTPYWNWLVTLFPMSFAPNLITLLGLAFVGVNFVTLLYFEPTLQCVAKPVHKSLGGSWDPLFAPSKESYAHAGLRWVSSKLGFIKSVPEEALLQPCPGSWMYFSFAIGLFIYQSLDAIDGKQARRTGTSSPLGEMFDHGCDAINTTLEVILTASALNLGQGWWTVASQVATLANFYLTTWEEYNTSVLFLSAFSGPVEGILMICVIFTITGFKGPQFWDQGVLTVTGLKDVPQVAKLGIKDLPLNDAFLVFGLAGLLFNIISSYANVVSARRKAGKSTLTPLFGLLPFAVTATLNVLWLRGTPAILREHLITFCAYWGISFAYQVGLLIVAHVTKGPFPYYNMLMIVSALGALDSVMEIQPSKQLLGNDGPLALVYVALGLALALYAFFVLDVIYDVCDFFDINCLTIKRKEPKGKEAVKSAKGGKKQ